MLTPIYSVSADFSRELGENKLQICYSSPCLSRDKEHKGKYSGSKFCFDCNGPLKSADWMCLQHYGLLTSNPGLLQEWLLFILVKLFFPSGFLGNSSHTACMRPTCVYMYTLDQVIYTIHHSLVLGLSFSVGDDTGSSIIYFTDICSFATVYIQHFQLNRRGGT